MGVASFTTVVATTIALNNGVTVNFAGLTLAPKIRYAMQITVAEHITLDELLTVTASCRSIVGVMLESLALQNVITAIKPKIVGLRIGTFKFSQNFAMGLLASCTFSSALYATAALLLNVVSCHQEIVDLQATTAKTFPFCLSPSVISSLCYRRDNSFCNCNTRIKFAYLAFRLIAHRTFISPDHSCAHKSKKYTTFKYYILDINSIILLEESVSGFPSKVY